MPVPRLVTRCWLPLALAACAPIAPRPELVDIDELPRVELSERQQQRCATLEQQAVAAIVQRRYEEAGELARRLVAIDPRSARGRAVQAIVRQQASFASEPPDWFQMRSGETLIEQARQLAPEDAFVGWLHALFLEAAGHVSAAALAAEAAIERTTDAPDSERAPLLAAAGTFRYELGEERAALPHLQAYVALRPDDVTAHFRLGICQLRIANTPQGIQSQYRTAYLAARDAVRAFRRCQELAPGDEDAALSVATAELRAAELAELLDRGDDRDRHRQQAIDHLQAVATRFPDSAEARFRIGVVAAQLDETELARASYGAALELEPEHVGSLLNLAAMRIADADEAAARTLLERALATSERDGALSGDERQRIEAWLAR